MRKFLLILALLVTCFIPMKVNAENKSYAIDKLKITANITEKGDVEVQEEITYNFHGGYNGIYRTLLKNGCNGHSVSQISIKDKSNNIILLSNTNDSKNNTYEIIDSNDNTKIKIFSQSTDEVKTFIFNYTILAAATKYKDYGELNWSFYKVENNIPVNSVDLKLSLKNSKFDLNKFQYWSYVDGGEFNTNYNENGIHLIGNNLTNLLGLKVQFQPEFLKVGEKSNDNNINQNIPNNPPNNNYVNKEPSEGNSRTFTLIAIVSVIIFIGAFSYRKNNKKFKQALEKYRLKFDFYSGETLEQVPSDLSPALVNFLYNEKSISNSVIPSTLFYLCKKGYYTMEKRKYNKSSFLESDETEELCFIKNSKASNPASLSLIYFTKWFSTYEENGSFSLKSIQEMVSTRKEALEFRDSLAEWKHIVKEEAEELGFNVIIEGRKVLSNKAYNEKLKWLAYRQYLIEQFAIEAQSITITNIDEALIYASALEIREIYSEVFSRKLSSFSYNNSNSYSYNMYDNNSFFLVSLYMWDSIDDSVRKNTIDNGNNNGNNNGGGNDGGFGGFSGGGDFSGGGGGDSGAF